MKNKVLTFTSAYVAGEGGEKIHFSEITKNPGNLAGESNISWKGKTGVAEVPMSSGPRFFDVYSDVKWGVRAMARTIANKIFNNQILVSATWLDVVRKYDPVGSETVLRNYANFISSRLGITPGQITTDNFAMVILAFHEHECGYLWLTSSDLASGLELYYSSYPSQIPGSRNVDGSSVADYGSNPRSSGYKEVTKGGESEELSVSRGRLRRFTRTS